MEDIKKTASMKKKKGKLKSIIFIVSGSIIALCWIIGVTIFLINRIPTKYYGTYVRYYYNDGYDGKLTYKISPLSVKATYEGIENGKKVSKTKNYKYYKKGNDVIIKDKTGNFENYLIIEDDLLYIESSKDISTSKEYKFYYWNVKSSKADYYEMENKSEKVENMIEETMNTWTRKSVYDSFEKELKDKKFYIYNLDEKTDETNLYSYEVIYKAAGGELSLYYDRKTKELERVYFSGIISSSLYLGTDENYMSGDDLYDAKAMLISFMYILGNKKNIDLNIDTENSKDYEKVKADLEYRIEVMKEYLELLTNRQVDEEYDNNYTFTLDNDKYNIKFENWIDETDYSMSGIISFNISVK